jgi:hypothetical protein
MAASDSTPFELQLSRQPKAVTTNGAKYGDQNGFPFAPPLREASSNESNH